MKKSAWFIATLLYFFTALVYAHGPVRQKEEKSITINAPIEKVWDLIKDFGSIQTWSSEVFTATVTGANEAGAVRVLTLKDGNSVTEELTKYEADKYSYSYKINEMSTAKTITYNGTEEKIPAIPVANFSATITLKADGANTNVIWKAAYYRAYTNNLTINGDPQEMNEVAANTAVQAFLGTGLIDLKTLAEK
ncbi:MAG: SRPBCC family protein [Methylococcaceae bacterium]